MANQNEHIKEPLFHVVKREQMPMWKSLAVRAIAILSSLLLCGIICLVFLDINPLDFYETMFKGAFGSERRVWKMIKDLSVLLCISLAVTPAFKMRFWNIGAEGQVLVGCLASVACIFYFGGTLPEPVLLVVMLVAAVLASSIWAVIPAIFKAFL